MGGGLLTEITQFVDYFTNFMTIFVIFEIQKNDNFCHFLDFKNDNFVDRIFTGLIVASFQIHEGISLQYKVTSLFETHEDLHNL